MKIKRYGTFAVIAVLSACLLLAGCASGTAYVSATAAPEPDATVRNTPYGVTPASSVNSPPEINTDEALDEDEDEASDEDEDEPIPSPPPFADTKVLKTFKQDIDGDGSKETVSVAQQTVKDPEEDYSNIFVYVQDGADTKGTYVDCPVDFNSAYITKTGSGSACLVVSLQYEDLNYSTFFFSLSSSAAVLESTLNGCVSAVNRTEIKIEDWGDALGSWNYYQKFKLGDDFSLTAATEMMIMLDGERKSLHTIKQLPVWMLVDGVIKKTFIKEGENIIPVSTDCRSYLKFKLKNGSEGRINFTRGGEYGDFLIGGVNEKEYFNNIDYWG